MCLFFWGLRAGAWMAPEGLAAGQSWGWGRGWGRGSELWGFPAQSILGLSGHTEAHTAPFPLEVSVFPCIPLGSLGTQKLCGGTWAGCWSWRWVGAGGTLLWPARWSSVSFPQQAFVEHLLSVALCRVLEGREGGGRGGVLGA